MSKPTRWQDLFPESTSPPYTEYGKVFHSDGVSELKTLSSSDSRIEAYAADFYLKEYTFHKLASPLAMADNLAIPGRVSAALKRINEVPLDGYLFAQIQKRNEGEFIKSANPRLDRYFLQARFTYLALEVMRKVYKHQLGLFRGILYGSQKDSPTIKNQDWYLYDYVAPSEQNLPAWQIALTPIQSVDAKDNFAGGIVKALIKESQPLDNKSEFVRRPSPIAIVKPGLRIEEKLEILDRVQYYVFPILGVITFSLDSVIDKSVILYFYEKNDHSIPVYTEEKLSSIKVQGNLSDYYDVALQMPPDGLYDKDFKRLLKEGRTTLEAGSKFIRLSYNIHLEELDRWIDKIRNTFGDQGISPASADSIYDSITDHATIQIIRYRRTPINIVLSLLEYQERRTKGNLLAYLPFHFAVPAEKRKSHAFERAVVQLFQGATATNTPELLDQIPHNLLELTIKELLLHARDVHFKSDLEFGPSVLLSLLQRADRELFTVLSTIVPTDPMALIGDIVDQIRLTPLDWEPDKIYSFWDAIDPHIFELYVLLLDMLITSKKNQDNLINNANRFWNFLKQGRGLLLDSSNPRFRIISGVPSQLSYLQLGEVALLPKLESVIEKKLRDVSLKVAVSRKADNIQFAESWLFAELSYTQLKIVKEDIVQLQQDFDSAKLELNKANTFEFRYLVSFGKLKPVSSLKNVCRNCNGDVDNLLNSTNPVLFNVAADIWVDKGIPLMPDDLVVLIHQLPQSNQLLAKIVSSEQQIESVVNLDAAYALLWLTSTAGTLRRDYQQDGEDFLCKCLLNLKKPNSTLAWRILVEEEAAFPANMDWHAYVNICRLLQSRLVDNKSRNLDYLDFYIRLVTKSSDSQKIGLVNRQLVKRFISKIFHGHAPDAKNFTELELIGLYSYYSQTTENQVPKQIIELARDFLISYLSSGGFFNSWERLSTRTKSLLKTFAQLERKSIPQDALEVINHWNTGLASNIKDGDPISHTAQPTKKGEDILELEREIGIIDDRDDTPNSTWIETLGFLALTCLGVISLLVIVLFFLKLLGIFDFILWLDSQRIFL
jgi:hypothetical protein